MFKNYYNDTDIFQIIVIDINILKKITKISIFKQMTLLGTIFPKSVDISIIGMAYRYMMSMTAIVAKVGLNSTRDASCGFAWDWTQPN